MALITDLELRADAQIDGTEEYVVNVSGEDFKVNGSGIVKAVTDSLDSFKETTNNSISDLQNKKLDITGGTLTGAIVLSGAPTLSNHPATKNYVDTLIASKASAVGATLDTTSAGVTQIDTNESTRLATTEYVANKIEYEVRKKSIISSTPVSLTEAQKGTILVNITATSASVINLPEISSLVNPDRVEYNIIDSGLNAETNNITINAYAGDSLDSGTSLTINTNGGTATLVCNSLNDTWYQKDKEQTASSTAQGLVELASTAEAEALSSATRVITPSTASDILDYSLFKRTAVGATPYAPTEAVSGILGVTLAGTVTINLPAISGFTNPQRVVYKIVDERGTALTGNITINGNGAEVINGAASHVITDNYGSIILYNDGTNWFSLADKNTFSVGAKVYRNAVQAIPDAADDKVEFDTEIADNQTQYDNVTNFRFTATYGGDYLATAFVGFLANATGYRMLKIVKNGTAIKAKTTALNQGAAVDVYLSCSAMFGLAAGDYVECFVYQNSGAPLNLLGTGDSSAFSIMCITR